jgi:hypothetical protein
MMKTESGDSSPANGGEGVSQDAVVVDVIDQAEASRILAAVPKLLAALDEASRIYHQSDRVTDRETGRNAGPPKLHAVTRAVLGFASHLQDIDRGEGNDRRMQPVMELLKALDDLRKGRERPDWIKGHKLTNHGVDGAAIWGARGLAAGVLKRMIDAKIPALDAKNLVWEVAYQHGLVEKSDKLDIVYGWLRRCREGKPGPALGVLVHSYHLFLETFGALPKCSDADKERIKKELPAFLARELTHRGFPPLRKPTR